MNRLFKRSTVALAGGITLAVALVFAAGAYFYSNRHFETLLASAREAAVAQGEVVRTALEHQMLEKDRTLIAEMVHSFGRQEGVLRLDLLDHGGRLKFSSQGMEGRGSLSVEDPACQSCHGGPLDQVEPSRILESVQGSLLQVVIPIANEETCHQCHDPASSINGLLILDQDLTGLRAAMNRDLRWMVVVSGFLTLFLVGAIAAIIQIIVLRRLKRFETTARRISEGDLNRRVPVNGSDTISWLAREFNAMADSMSGLIDEVGSQRERLETVINSIDDGIVVLDPSRTILAANEAFLNRTGHVREEVLGCACGDVAKGICTTSDCPTVACLHSGERQIRVCERRGEDGSVAWEEVHSSPILGPDGDIAQIVEVWRDITERRRVEARMSESHRLASLGMLASGFSHEMNTPLATVLTCVEGILRETKNGNGDGEISPYIEKNAAIARDQVLRCKGITQHFLRLSRGQSSPGDLVDVRSAVEAVARLVKPTAEARDVSVKALGGHDGLRVRAGEAELQHALVNILINAIDACDPGGEVEVGVEHADSVRLWVKDNGRGLNPDEIDRIFEPFVSLRTGGTGLGLFLALNFVRQWGGDIQVVSRPGRGSTFTISLPSIGKAKPLEVLS